MIAGMGSSSCSPEAPAEFCIKTLHEQPCLRPPNFAVISMAKLWFSRLDFALGVRAFTVMHMDFCGERK
jgi:hypothetical protein